MIAWQSIILHSVATATFFVYSYGMSSASADESTRVVESLIERGRHYKTLEIDWSGTAFEKAVIRSSLGKSGKQSIPDLNYRTSGRLLCDTTGRLRFELRGSKWSTETESVVPREMILVLNRGELQRMFGGGGRDHLRLHNGGDDASRPSNHIGLLGVRLAYWPLDPELGVCKANELVDEVKYGKVDGRDSQILRFGESEIWVDTERSKLPIRFRKIVKGIVTLVVDVDYKDTDGEWELANWKISHMRGGQVVLRSYSEHVTLCKANITLNDSEFALEAPVGAYVHDYEKNERFVVRSNGEMRKLAKGEFTGDNVRELAYGSPWSWIRVPIVVTLSVVGLGAAMLVYRRFRDLRQRI